jgi:hypothetical protein
MGAINTGRTICGILFGGSIFLGFHHGSDAAGAPEVNDEKRSRAIASVNGLFQGFIDRFSDTDCKTLTGCDFSKKEDVDRYIQEEVYKDKCFKYFEYVLARCLGEIDRA